MQLLELGPLVALVHAQYGHVLERGHDLLSIRSRLRQGYAHVVLRRALIAEQQPEHDDEQDGHREREDDRRRLAQERSQVGAG